MLTEVEKLEVKPTQKRKIEERPGVNLQHNATTSPTQTKGKKPKVDLFKYFQQQVQSQNPPRLVSFKRKISSSKYKGVLYVKSQSKWRAQVCLGGKKKYIGSYDSEIEAAMARDTKIKQLFGDRPELLNFPKEDNRVYCSGAQNMYYPSFGNQPSQEHLSQFNFTQLPFSAFSPVHPYQQKHQYSNSHIELNEDISPVWLDKWQTTNVYQECSYPQHHTFIEAIQRNDIIEK